MKKAVVWKVNGLGDFVTYLPTLSKLIAYHGMENIFFVLSPISLEVLKTFFTPVHYKIISRADFIQLYKHPIKLFRFVSDINRFCAQRAYFTYDECATAYLASFLAFIPERIGYASNITIAQKLLTKKLQFSANKNIYAIHADLLSTICFSKLQHSECASSTLDLVPQQTDTTVIPRNPYIVLHPFAQFSYREWSFENYSELAGLIERELNIKTIMIGEHKHKSLFVHYRYEHFLSLSVSDLFCLIKEASLFIGNNSGPMHIAITVNTPFISIEGPSAENWGPNNPTVKYKRIKNQKIACLPCETIFQVPKQCVNEVSPNACLKSITAIEVFEHVQKLLES